MKLMKLLIILEAVLNKCDVLWGQMRYHDGEMSALNSLVKEIEEILIKTYNITHDSIS